MGLTKLLFCRFLYAQAGCEREELFDGAMKGDSKEVQTAPGPVSHTSLLQAKTFEEQRAKLSRGEETLRQAKQEMQDSLAVSACAPNDHCS